MMRTLLEIAHWMQAQNDDPGNPEHRREVARLAERARTVVGLRPGVRRRAEVAEELRSTQ